MAAAWRFQIAEAPACTNRRAAICGEKRMITNDTPADKASATDCTDPFLADHVYLGRDREGFVHHLDREANVVYRFDDDGMERVSPLGEKHLDDYLAFVADQIGWAVRKQAATWDFFPEAR